MMKFVVISTHNDLSVDRICEATRRAGHKLERYDYKELLSSRREQLRAEVLIARQPYVANNIEEEYTGLLSRVLQKGEFGFVLDKRLYEKTFDEYEDKYWQTALMARLGLRVPMVYETVKVEDKLPVIVKKRISSRGKGNYVIETSEDWQRFIADHDNEEYMVQQYLPLEADYRVLVLGDRVLGVVKRRMREKEKGRIGVRAIKSAKVPKEIELLALKLCREVGVDFCGVDVGKTKQDEYVFWEYNPSPQFRGFERVSGVDVAGELVNWCEKRVEDG